MAVTVPAVKTALLALFNANAWPTAAPQITWGGPTESEDQPRGGELLYFADVREMEEINFVLGGGRPIDESYSLRIHIDVKVDGDDEQAAEIRAWALYESLRRVLWTNRKPVDGPGVMTVDLVGRTVTQTNVLIEKAWISRIQVDQAVKARVFNP